MSEATGRGTTHASATSVETAGGRSHRAVAEFIVLGTLAVLKRVERVGNTEHHVSCQIVVAAVGDSAVRTH